MRKKDLTPEEQAAREERMAKAREKVTKRGRKSKKQIAAELAEREQNKTLEDLNEEINYKAEKLADKIVQQRMNDMVTMARNVSTDKTIRRMRPEEKTYRKFTCQDLIMMFGGWFTLTYAFSIKNGLIDKDGNEGETHFYICSQDVNGMNVNERPPLNAIIKREFGKDVYGFAIIAPASAFGE